MSAADGGSGDDPLALSQGMLALVRKLAHNEKEDRDRAVSKLKVFLASRRADTTTELDFLKLWKGLFYCMWMSDKIPVQQELAAELATLIHRFQEPALASLWLRAFLLTMRREWSGIDKYRLDKYYSLMRKVLHESFALLREAAWDDNAVAAVTQLVELHFQGHEQSKRQGTGVTLHFLEVFMEELFKAAGAGITTRGFLSVFQPVLDGYCTTASLDTQILKRIESSMFDALGGDYWFKDCRRDPAAATSGGGGGSSSEEGEEEEGTKVFRSTELAAITARLWAAASAPDTVQQRRKAVYATHKRLKRLLRANGTHYAVTVAPLEQDLPSMSPVKQKQQQQQQHGRSKLVVRGGDADSDDDSDETNELNDSTATEKMFDEDEGGEKDSGASSSDDDDDDYGSDGGGADADNDGWSSDDVRDMHGPPVPPGWGESDSEAADSRDDDDDDDISGAAAAATAASGAGVAEMSPDSRKRVRIQLASNRSKSHKNSVRDLKRRKLQNAANFPNPQGSILKPSSHPPVPQGRGKQTKKKNNNKANSRNSASSFMLNTASSYQNQFEELASHSTGGGRAAQKKSKRRNKTGGRR